MLNKSLNVSGDTNLEFTLPTTKITGTIYDVNNKKYENSVDVCMYRSNDLDTRYYSVSDYTSDGTYLFQGVPDGQYVLVVSGQKDGKYFRDNIRNDHSFRWKCNHGCETSSGKPTAVNKK